MQDVHLEELDLNLLAVLEVLLETHSVTATARRVGLTQSATSHALARLRAALGDPLLVRAGAAMVPTARATALAGPLRDALDGLRRAIAPPAPFDPRKARRTLRLASADYTEVLLVPALARRLAVVAPRIELRFVSATSDPARLVAAGEIDLFTGTATPDVVRGDLRWRTLLEERFVCLVRRGHPSARRGWTLEEFAALDHCLVSPRGQPGSIVDDLLAARGLARRVAVTTTHFLVAPFVVAGSDLVLTLPERVARRFAAHLPVRVLEPPVEVPRFTVGLVWHERQHADPVHAWLREELATVARRERRR